jgi:hypothetical protein
MEDRGGAEHSHCRREGDICDPDLGAWTDADLVFMSSLCFPDAVMQVERVRSLIVLTSNRNS